MNWKDIVKTVAPILGTALGGPLAGGAIKFLGDKLLGNSSASETALSDAILAASPETLAKLKEWDTQYAIEELKDRQNARQREIELAKLNKSDWLPKALAIGTALVFFSIVYIAFVADIDPSVRDVALMLVGMLAARYGSIMDYYFGSSQGSAEKSKWLAQK